MSKGKSISKSTKAAEQAKARQNATIANQNDQGCAIAAQNKGRSAQEEPKHAKLGHSHRYRRRLKCDTWHIPVTNCSSSPLERWVSTPKEPPEQKVILRSMLAYILLSLKQRLDSWFTCSSWQLETKAPS
jgi:hypothetical protein